MNARSVFLNSIQFGFDVAFHIKSVRSLQLLHKGGVHNLPHVAFDKNRWGRAHADIIQNIEVIVAVHY